MDISPEEMKKIETLHSSKYKNLKGQKLIDAIYASGAEKIKQLRTLIGRLRKGIQWETAATGEIKDAIVEAYKDFKKTHNKIPRTGDIYNYKSVSKLMTTNKNYATSHIGRVLRDNNLDYIRGKELIHSSAAERNRAMLRARRLKELKFSGVDWEYW